MTQEVTPADEGSQVVGGVLSRRTGKGKKGGSPEPP